MGLELNSLNKVSGIPKSLKDQLVDLALTYPEIERVILFGSRARGDAESRSDIDLAIVAPAATPRQWLNILFGLEEEADTLLSIDVTRWEEASDALRTKIVSEGQILYERHQIASKPE